MENPTGNITDQELWIGNRPEDANVRNKRIIILLIIKYFKLYSI